MKRILRGMVLFSMVSLAGLAAQQQSVSINLYNPTLIGQQTVQRGSYRVIWGMSDHQPQVSFLQGRKVVATVTATVTPADNVSLTKNVPNGVGVATKKKGDKEELKELELPHFNLTFAE